MSNNRGELSNTAGCGDIYIHIFLEGIFKCNSNLGFRELKVDLSLGSETITPSSQRCPASIPRLDPGLSRVSVGQAN